MDLQTTPLRNTLKDCSPKEELTQLKKILTDRVYLGGRSLAFFSVDILNLEWGEHHEQWKTIAKGDRKALIECARGHGKSYFWAYAYPIWKAKYAITPISICLVSYSQDQVMVLAGRIKTAIEQNEMLLDMLPKDYRDTWTKTEMRFSNGSTVTAKSFGSAMRGGHYDLIIVDDPTKDRADMSEEDMLNFFYSVLYPTLNPGGQIIIDGTPVKFGDILEHIEENTEFKSYKFPAIKKDGSALWPGRYSLETLDEIKRTQTDGAKGLGIGSWRFSREYLLERISPDTAPLKKEWLRYWEKLPEGVDYYTFMAVDPNISKEETADHTGIMVVKVDCTNNWYLVDVIKQRFNPLELINEIYRLYDKWHPLCIGLEIVAFQKVLSYWLQEESSKRGVILPIKEIKSTKSKNERIMGLQPRMESGKLIIHPTMLAVTLEIEKFRLEVDGSDDCLDALAMLNEIAYIPEKRVEDVLAGLPPIEQKVWRELDKIYADTGRKEDDE